MKLLMLGTGHGSAINCYNTCFLLNDKLDYFLIDSGGGNQILKHLCLLNVKISDIKNIFISHSHMDHILGITWLLRRLCPKYHNKIIHHQTNIYGNNDVIKKLTELLNILLPLDFHYLINDKFILHVINDNEKIIFGNMHVEFIDLHAVKIKQFGFILRQDSKVFSFIGDEPCNEKIEKKIKGSDYLFADAYMCGEIAEIYNPQKRHQHSTVKYSASIAQKLNVKSLILSHTIDTNLESRKNDFIRDANKYFDGTVYVPDDLEEIDLW